MTYVGLQDIVKRWVYTPQGVRKVMRSRDFPAPSITINVGKTKVAAAGKYSAGPNWSIMDNSSQSQEATQTTPNLPVPVDGAPEGGSERNAPPRVRKPSPIHNQYLAPAADLEGFRARLRDAFGNTMSDEFVDVMLGKVIEALKSRNLFDQLEEATLNSALAIIASARCRSELEAFIALQIVATGFAGLRFLRQSQHSMTEEYIGTYGPYANKLLRLELDLIQALDRHRRGHKQTVEVRHLHIYPGAQGMVGIINKESTEWRGPKMTNDPIRQADIERRLANMC